MGGSGWQWVAVAGSEWQWVAVAGSNLRKKLKVYFIRATFCAFTDSAE